MTNAFSGRRQFTKYRFMVVILALTAFIPTVKTGFMWDDHIMIEANPYIRSWSLENLKHDFSHDVFDGHGDPYYRPIQTLMNRLDYALWGLQPLGFHLTNLAFHIGNALLILELLTTLGFGMLSAFLAASLFAVHPIGVEQLMIIAGRAELMALFFILAGLLFALRRTRRSAIWSWVAYIAALLTKESSVVFPFLLALCYYAQNKPRKTYQAILPYIAAIPVYLWIRTSAVGPVLTQSDSWLTLRFFVQEFPSVIIKYLGLLIWPWNLHSHRLLPHLSHAWPLYIVIVTAAGIALTRRYGRLAGFSIGWFLLSLLPKTPVMIYGNFMLDHWAYPAALSVVLPLGVLVEAGWTSGVTGWRGIAGAGYFFAIIVWSLLVHLNVALRGSDESMYRWALRFTTSSPIRHNLGVLLLDTGRPDEAAHYLEMVHALYPDDPDNTRALAIAYWKAGHPGAAVEILTDFMRHFPPNAGVHHLLNAMRAQTKKLK